MMQNCTCLSISRDPLCVYHGDVDKVKSLQPDAPDVAALRKMVEKFVDDLFTNGSGQQADRLVLTVDGPPKRDLGGWYRAAIADRLDAALLAVLPAAPAPEAGAEQWFAVYIDGEPSAAYPRRLQAEVYASGCSGGKPVQIRELGVLSRPEGA